MPPMLPLDLLPLIPDPGVVFYDSGVWTAAALGSLLTLTLLEVILGIDNVVFIAILTGKLPKEQRPKAQKIGLGLAALSRIALLFGAAFVLTLDEPQYRVVDVSGWFGGDEAAQVEPAEGHDDMLGPRGPDAPQGRTPGEDDPDRHRGAPSDEAAEGNTGAPEVERKGHPEEGAPAPETKTDGKASDTEAAGQTGTSVPGSGREATEDEVGGKAADTTGASDGPKRAPGALDGPRDGGKDDLKRIDGVGPKLEEMLNERGVYHFDQIAAWSDDDLDQLDEALGAFPGRARRDDWVGQAKKLST